MKRTRTILLQALKMTLGALAAILIAQALGLKYSATAGIITLLSILGTKRETLRIAGGRLMAFGAAMVVAWACYGLLGYTVWGFAVYLLVFSGLCLFMGWTYALTMVSVLVSHFMSEGAMTLPLLANEGLLFLIGAGCGIAVNLTLQPDEPRLARLMHRVDEDMKALLPLCICRECRKEALDAMDRLGRDLRRASELAVANLNNTLRRASEKELRYIEMRSRQRDVLGQIMAAVEKMEFVPEQQQAVSAMFQRAAEEYHAENDVQGLLEGLSALLQEMKAASLPTSREEFESRALLYYALLRLEEFLRLKRRFHREWLS